MRCSIGCYIRSCLVSSRELEGARSLLTWVGRTQTWRATLLGPEDDGVRLHPPKEQTAFLWQQHASFSAPASLTWSSTRQLPNRAPLPKTARCTRVVVTTNTIFPSSMGCCKGSFSLRRGPRWPPRRSRSPSSLAWHTSLLLQASCPCGCSPLALPVSCGNLLFSLSLSLSCCSLPVFLECVPRRYGKRQARTETLVPTLQTLHHWCWVAIFRALSTSRLLWFPNSEGLENSFSGYGGGYAAGLFVSFFGHSSPVLSASAVVCLTSSVREP